MSHTVLFLAMYKLPFNYYLLSASFMGPCYIAWAAATPYSFMQPVSNLKIHFAQTFELPKDYIKLQI